MKRLLSSMIFTLWLTRVAFMKAKLESVKCNLAVITQEIMRGINGIE